MRTKINGDKLRTAIITALIGKKEGRLTAADITTEVANVLGFSVEAVEKSIITQKGNTTSPEDKRGFFVDIVNSGAIEFVTVRTGGSQGAPKADNSVWAKERELLADLLK